MCDFIKPTLKLANQQTPVIIDSMKTSYLVDTNSKEFINESKNFETCGESGYLNCSIAKDASRKLDFLILVIETLQINAADSLFLKANNIGLSDEFTSRVQFWKIRCLHKLNNDMSLLIC